MRTLKTEGDGTLEARVRELERLIGSAVETPEQYTLADRLRRLEELLKSGEMKTQLSGHVMELYVTDWDDLPDPASVPLGATAQLIGTFDVRQSDGSDWVEAIL